MERLDASQRGVRPIGNGPDGPIGEPVPKRGIDLNESVELCCRPASPNRLAAAEALGTLANPIDVDAMLTPPRSCEDEDSDNCDVYVNKCKEFLEENICPCYVEQSVDDLPLSKCVDEVRNGHVAWRQWMRKCYKGDTRISDSILDTIPWFFSKHLGILFISYVLDEFKLSLGNHAHDCETYVLQCADENPDFWEGLLSNFLNESYHNIHTHSRSHKRLRI